MTIRNYKINFLKKNFFYFFFLKKKDQFNNLNNLPYQQQLF
jgi:hypothetical protein